MDSQIYTFTIELPTITVKIVFRNNNAYGIRQRAEMREEKDAGDYD